MKVITIPDLHGKDVWKELDLEEFDKIIFLGDYVDAPYKSITDIPILERNYTRPQVSQTNGKSNEEILNNFIEIIDLKKNNPEKIELLLGNHDIPYYMYSINPSLYQMTRCTGHRTNMLLSLGNVFQENKGLFKIAHQIDDVLWSHAGISQSAFDLYFHNVLSPDSSKWADDFNNLFENFDKKLFYISHHRGGSHPHGSILWTHESEFYEMKNYELPIRQVVGHNRMEKITCLYGKQIILQDFFEISIGEEKLNVTFTDVLDSTKSFYYTEF